MYVDLDHRKEGIGGKLLDHEIAYAKNQLNAKAVYLAVESSNTVALDLYRSRGFRSWGREPFALFSDGEFFDEDHMLLALT